MTLDGFALDLLVGAVAIAVTHTLLGPDHYLPFVMMARAGRWSPARTGWVTALCGVGHVLSSVAVGAIGLGAGLAVAHIEGIETRRGDWAAWALIAVGTAYTLWGVRKAIRAKRGLAPHVHGSAGHLHIHTHGSHPHHHDAADPRGAQRVLGFWALFTVFVLGPCEPLIPLFVLPASRGRWGLALATALLFGVVTIALMVGVVLGTRAGLVRLPLGRLEPWSHAVAGAVVTASGLAVVFLGL